MNRAKVETLTSSDQEPWGYDLRLSLTKCNPITPKLAAAYAQELCKVIDMKPFGDPITSEGIHPRTGDLMKQVNQLIETSNILTLYEPSGKIVLIDIFSCRKFDDKTALKFSQNYFGGTLGPHDLLIRK